MRYKNVIFDFDGTLCDTSQGVINSVFYALDSLGVEVDRNNIDTNRFIGPPLLFTFQEYLKADAKTAQELVKKYRERYTNSCLLESELYPGIKDLLKRLCAGGFSLGIASSKPTKYITELLSYFGISKYFSAVCGVSFNADCESKASIIMRCMDELGGSAKNSLVIGDTHYDIDAACADFVDSCAVSWGFESTDILVEAGARYVAKSAGDIENIAMGLYETTVQSDLIYDGKILQLKKNRALLSDGSEAERELVVHSGGVAVAAITENNEILLVRQFRTGAGGVLSELPAGKLESGENPQEAAIRELKEECGCEAENIFEIAAVYPTPAYCSEVIHIYGALGLSFGEAKPDSGEFLDSFTMPFQRAVQLCLSNEISDAKTVIGILKMKERLEKQAQKKETQNTD
ncbi:MAG: HAD hydrolase-like protein [Clostridiales bacterium]|nr:HAD hydrolase-like protein [Clostridiales bacterium]